MGTATVVSGCFGDELEIQWLRECWSKSFDSLECSDLDGTVDQTRWRRLDFSLSKALQGMIRSSGESLSEDITLTGTWVLHSGAIFSAGDKLSG